MRRKLLDFVACIAVFIFIFATHAYAHDPDLTYTKVKIEKNDINLSFITPYRNILAYYPEKNKAIEDIDLKFFIQTFNKGLTVSNNGQPCTPSLQNIRNATDIKSVEYKFDFSCKEGLDKIQFKYNLFFDIDDGHENITKISINKDSKELVFSRSIKSYDLAVGEIKIRNAISSGFNFFVLGVKHILAGYDHIMFLIGLLLVTVSVRGILKIVTSFTMAHSITLIIAALGIFVLPPRLTEASIALSIIYVAVENLLVASKFKWPEKYKFFQFFGDPSKRKIHTFFFGLIHGFGFSFVLREIGLPKEGLVQSLLLFNVGVEVGQLCIVLLLFPILWLLRKTKWNLLVVRTLSVVLGLFGLFWFIERVFL